MYVEQLYILGASDGSAKLIGLLIVLAIWGIGALANWVSKQANALREAQRKGQVRQSMQGQRGGVQQTQGQRINPAMAKRPGPVVNVPRVMRPMQQPAARVQQPNARAQQPVSRRVAAAMGARAPARPVTPPPLTKVQQAPASQPAVDPRDPQVQRQRPTSAGAGAIAAWLKPGTLRQQFVLTEVLQPPVALRDERI
jgi:hypothetical protein